MHLRIWRVTDSSLDRWTRSPLASSPCTIYSLPHSSMPIVPLPSPVYPQLCRLPSLVYCLFPLVCHLSPLILYGCT